MSQTDSTFRPVDSPPLRCPACGSPQVVCRRPGDVGRATGAALGAVAGAAAALADAWRRPAEATDAGGGQTAPSRLSQVVLGVLSGAALGCQAGAATGQVLGTGIGSDHSCLSCGKAFRG